MEVGIYKVVICNGLKNESYYIKVESYGEFSKKEFVSKEFNLTESSYINPTFTVMLKDGSCVTLLDGPINEQLVPKKILDTITEELTFNIEDLALYKTCEECNLICYGLEKEDGTIIYPENSDELKFYSQRVLSVEYDEEVFYARVVEYKCSMHQKSGESVDIIDGCWSDFPSDIIVEKESNICHGRVVDPDVLTKTCEHVD